jgi:hypothetical protein
LEAPTAAEKLEKTRQVPSIMVRLVTGANNPYPAAIPALWWPWTVRYQWRRFQLTNCYCLQSRIRFQHHMNLLRGTCHCKSWDW